jgi:hypothetical protein
MRITFQRGETPNVFVMDPELSALAGGRALPHVYQDPLRLCLTLPGTREWTGTMRIDRDIRTLGNNVGLLFRGLADHRRMEGGGKHPDPTDNERYGRRERRATRQPRI